MTRAMEGEEGTMARPEIEADVSSCFGYDQTLPLANIPLYTQSMLPGGIHRNLLSINHERRPR